MEPACAPPPCVCSAPPCEVPPPMEAPPLVPACCPPASPGCLEPDTAVHITVVRNTETPSSPSVERAMREVESLRDDVSELEHATDTTSDPEVKEKVEDVVHGVDEVKNELEDAAGHEETATETEEHTHPSLLEDGVFERLSEDKEEGGFVDRVKAGLVPFLRERLLGVKIPDVSGDESVLGAKIHYELKDIHLSAISVDADHVAVSAVVADGDPELTLSVNNINIGLEGVSWSFESPLLDDHGLASAEVYGGDVLVTVKLVMKDEIDVPQLVIQDFSLSFGDVKILLHKSSSGLEGVYNALLKALEPYVKRQVEQEATERIRGRLGEVLDLVNRSASRVLHHTLGTVVA
eukprot:TRINITY_DN423_c0_g1_i1.p2 TRINITY_DN423_c0_g1~~TRINITY_DN423_c0_g1_i1.p2  ORF type:complete len:391 (-),score=102.46 TRINITY_DN423_c0_g1_i1:67-1116(-)